jgi:phosphate:Na+ symporter
MSSDQTTHTQGIIKVVDEFESIADYLERIVSYKARFKNNPETGASLEEYENFMNKIWEFFEVSVKGLFNPDYHDYQEIFKRSEELRIWADDIRDRHLDRVSKGEYSPLSALTYSDMVVALRKIRAHSLNAAEALTMFKSNEE